MKKTFTRIITFTALFISAALSTSTFAQYKTGYYDKMDGKKKSELKQAAKTCVQAHKTLPYYDLPIYWESSDVYPEKYQGQTRWWEMYSNEIYLIKSGQSAKTSFSANKMQREHSIPKSWWKKNNDVEYTPAYSDMWNLYPSDGPANQAKLNYPLGETRSTTFDNGCTKVGSPVIGQGGGCAYVFEPEDSYKGDFARTCFYMATVYDDLPWVITYMFRQQTWPTLQPWAVEMLLKWHRQDPVSQKEIVRNNAVEQCQGNRNPFVDFPELAEYIWGTRTEETFLIAEQGGQVTPPITGDAELTLPVTGSSLDFGETAEGVAVTSWLRIAGNNLTSSLSVSLSGANKNMFTLGATSILPSQINGQDYFDLPIIYNPTAIGKHEAKLALYDGGLPDGTSIVVNLRGEGKQRPQLSTLTALEPTDVNYTKYTANWTAAPEVVDYYVVTRTRLVDNNIETDEYESPVNHITFTDRDADVTETYAVCSSRLGVISAISNTITVAATGVAPVKADPENYIRISPLGIVIAQDAPEQIITVYDMTGRVILSQTVQGGELISLPHGVFITTSNMTNKPVKTIIRRN